MKELFVGKSVNNASFLGAALVDQGVIRLHPQTARLLEVNDEYELWPLSFDDVVQQSSSLSESSHDIKPVSAKRGPNRRINNQLRMITQIPQPIWRMKMQYIKSLSDLQQVSDDSIRASISLHMQTLEHQYDEPYRHPTWVVCYL